MTVVPLDQEHFEDIVTILTDFAEDFLVVALYLRGTDISDETAEAGKRVCKAIEEFAELLAEDVVSE